MLVWDTIKEGKAMLVWDTIKLSRS